MPVIGGGGGGGGGSSLPSAEYDVRSFGAQCDVKVAFDGVLVEGPPSTLSSTSADWTSAHVGKTIWVNGAVYTIASVNSSTEVTLSGTSTYSNASDTPYAYGTDDAAALASAVAALPAEGGTILVPRLMFASTIPSFANRMGVQIRGVGGLTGVSIRGGKLATNTYTVPASGIIYTGAGSGVAFNFENSVGCYVIDCALMYCSVSYTGDLVAFTSATATATDNPGYMCGIVRCTAGPINASPATIHSANSCLNLSGAVLFDSYDSNYVGAKYPVIGVDPDAGAKGWAAFSNAVNFYNGQITDADSNGVLNPGQMWNFFGVTFEPPGIPAANGIMCTLPAQSVNFYGCGFWDATTAGGVWVTPLGQDWVFRDCFFENTGSNVVDIDCSTGDIEGLTIDHCRFDGGTGTKCVKPAAATHTVTDLWMVANRYTTGLSSPVTALQASSQVTFVTAPS